LKIAAAQVASIRGNIEANVATHAVAMEKAAEHGVSVLVFPELSLTGYEPDLCAELAILPTDRRMEPLRVLAREHRMWVVVGAPLRNGASKPTIGAILISAAGDISSYSKMHLGGSEPTFFAPGTTPMAIAVDSHTIGIAICADSSQRTHPQAYVDLGANIYAAGVFLNAEWYVTDVPRLRNYAAQYGLLTLMANHAASVGTYVSVGRSAIWAPGGSLLAQTEGVAPSLVIAESDKGKWRGKVVEI
jgi:predicted amidohydrolase